LHQDVLGVGVHIYWVLADICRERERGGKGRGRERGGKRDLNITL
jgi:hypothetical protein